MSEEIIIKKIEEQGERFDDLMEFLQENVVVKDDLKNFATKDDLKNFATKDDLKSLATKDDVNLLRKEFEAFRVETDGNFRMLRNELDDIKTQLRELEKRTIEDANVAAQDILKLQNRVSALEAQVRQMQAAR